MKSTIRMLVYAAAAFCAAGCTSPRTAPTMAPDERMLREVANAAAKDLLVSPQFHKYVESYRNQHGGGIPTLLGNGADKSDANVAFLGDFLDNVLGASGMVSISNYRPAHITFSPDATPEDMERAREKVCGRLPDILLRIKIATRTEVRARGLQADSHQFDFALFETASGQQIWRFRKSTGLVRKGP